MKNFILATLLWIALLSMDCLFGQSNFRLNRIDSFNFAIVIDPSASISELGLHVGAEIEYNGTVYTRASITHFAALENSYTDFVGAAGINFTSGMWEQLRYYAGLRAGIIMRESNGYPTLGMECGIDYVFNGKYILGIRATRDRRGDFSFYGEYPEMRNSGFVKIGIKL